MLSRLAQARRELNFPFTTALEWYEYEKTRQQVARQALRELPSEIEQMIIEFAFDYVLRSLFK